MADIISVTEFSTIVKSIVERDEFLSQIAVKGEVSNYKKNSMSGHVYFTLKDETSNVKCVMFKSMADKVNVSLKDGDGVIVFGRATVYKEGGYYQILVTTLKKEGVGELYEKYEELKEKLSKEGLFDTEHKKRIPKFPKTIGVVTSETGAVIHDIMTVARRRNPGINIILRPVPVQGEGAASKIAEAIRYFNKKNNVDVMIVGRGGGSIEDLWQFNEEEVVRAIYDSEIPVIAAVGHEQDRTLTNFVSDEVGSTPSAAAELAVPNIFELKEKMKLYISRTTSVIQNIINNKKMILDNAIFQIEKKNPKIQLENRKNSLEMIVQKMNSNIQKIMQLKKHEYEKTISSLEHLNPLKILARGYLVTEKDGKMITKAKELKKGDKLVLKYSDGDRQAEIL